MKMSTTRMQRTLKQTQADLYTIVEATPDHDGVSIAHAEKGAVKDQVDLLIGTILALWKIEIPAPPKAGE